MKWKLFLRTALFLLALNLLAENLGYLTHQLYQFLGILCIIFYGLSIFPFSKKTKRRGYLFAGYLLLIVSLFCLSGSILYRLAGAGIYLFSMGLLLQSKEQEEREIPYSFSPQPSIFSSSSSISIPLLFGTD